MVAIWREFSWLITPVAAVWVLVALVGVAHAIRASRKRGGAELLRPILNALIGLYGIAVMAVTLAPVRHSIPRTFVLDPFASEAIGTPTEVLLNAALLLPFGLLVLLRWPNLGIPKVVVMAAATVTAIELLQYLLPVGRVASTADILTGTVGALLGALLAAQLRRHVAAIRLSEDPRMVDSVNH